MARTQILVHRGGLEQEFQCCFANGLNQKFSFVCGAGYHSAGIMKKCLTQGTFRDGGS